MLDRMVTVFRTGRLTVREFVLADTADAFAMWSDPGMLRFTGDTAPRDESVIAADIERWNAVARQGAGCGFWAALAGDVLIGDVYVRPLPAAPPEHEIGWHVARPSWGLGYATELARGALDHAHDRGIARLVALVSPDNAASVRVAVKAGMTPEGETRRYEPDEPPVLVFSSERRPRR